MQGKRGTYLHRCDGQNYCGKHAEKHSHGKATTYQCAGWKRLDYHADCVICGQELLVITVTPIIDGLPIPPLVISKHPKMNQAQRLQYKKAAMNAAQIVHRAVVRGILPNLKETAVTCADCKVRRANNYDHRDYGKPLDVVAVCGRCNLLRGSAILTLV